ncbi:MAG: hypothetical protein M1820_002881 [Bogoriella megaspora]|nr:MAG: hypothetical protein M1820_002881 [Bogoriella megaspora]
MDHNLPSHASFRPNLSRPLQSQNLQTLPPLNNQPIYGQHPGSGPQTPVTPSTPHGFPHSNGFPNLAPQQQDRTMPPPSYAQGPPLLAHSQPMIPPPVTAMSSSHGLPSTTPTSRLPDLRPAPSGGFGSQQTLPSIHYGQQQQMLPQPSMQSSVDPAPTHVVGSQGRRGVLPSAPGRPVAMPGTGVNGKQQPQKDAEGKYPCEHCNKNYLHLKHLKRHMLRHTGDRPYQCHLCKDTFSRSDILKRHFQKCSLRRGNPTGANHLQHSQSHLRKNSQQANRLSMTSIPDNQYSMPAMDASNVVAGQITSSSSSSMQNNQVDPIGYQNGATTISNRSSRSNSVVQSTSVPHSQRNSVSNLGQISSTRQSFDQQSMHSYSTAVSAPSMQSYVMPSGLPSHSASHDLGYASHVSAASMAPTIKPEESTAQAYSRSSLPQYDGPHSNMPADFDWPGIFQNQQDPFAFSGNVTHEVKPTQPGSGNSTSLHSPTDGVSDAAFHSMYPQTSIGMDNVPMGFPTFNLDMVAHDPLQNKAEALLSFCFPNHNFAAHADQDLKQCFSAEGMKHFVALYTNFHGHWPIIHTTSFDIRTASEGLVAVMMSIGAVYSDRVNPDQVRRLMDVVHSAIQRTSHVYALITGTVVADHGMDQVDQNAMEEIQSLILLHTQFTWHGNRQQREVARREWPPIASIVKHYHLLHPIQPGYSHYSPLHDTSFPQAISSTSFDWTSWVEQEKRTRAMYCIFLVDAARVLYFNAAIFVDPTLVHIPLPADDAAWDAKSAVECADALGLNGEHSQAKNVTGSRRLRQMTLSESLRDLLSPQTRILPRATNALSKFVVIHGVHVLISNVQRQYVATGGSFDTHSSGTNTPNSFKDWTSASTTNPNSSNISANNSGRATPIEGLVNQQNYHQNIRTISGAVEKWKETWDRDMKMQYPPAASFYRRFGFCRDGVHFYYLARQLLNPKCAQVADPATPPESRFKGIMRMLRKIRSWVLNENTSRGEEVGSVGDIDDLYGIDELTFDMRKLFKPINEQLDSPISGIQTYMNNSIM